MDQMGTRQKPPTVRQRRLASELRALREAAGLTREEAAIQTDVNSATLYRIETARVRPQRRTLVALLNRYDVTDEAHRAELIALAKEASQLGWVQTYENDLPEKYMTYISFEAEARTVMTFESLLMPGLLQTEEYARAVIIGIAPQMTVDDVERRVSARIKRQNALTRKDPLNLWAILDEAVLHREVGGPKVMAEQLKSLVVTAGRPNVTLQILPYGIGAHPGMMGSFVVLDYPDPADPPLVYVETTGGDLFLEKTTEVRQCTGMFEHLRAVALSPTDSARRVAEIADTMAKGGAR